MSNDLDLDTTIRSFLCRIDDATPMAPPLSMLQYAEPAPYARRAVGLAVSAVIATAGVAGVVAMSVRGPSDSASTPVANETNSAEPGTATNGDSDPAPTLAATPATVAPPPQTVLPLDQPDGRLMAAMLSLLDVSIPEETVSFLSTNIAQDQVANCMHVGGFEYVEEMSPEEEVASNPRTTMTPDEFASRFGLGFAAEALGLVPQTPLEEQAPNLPYVQSLSKERQQEYFDTRNWCSGGNDRTRLRASTDVTEAIVDYRALLDADPAVVESLATWRACLAGAGFDYESPQAMKNTLSYRTLNIDTSTEQRQAQLAEEIAIAAVDLPCETAYTATYRRAAIDRSAEFRAMLDPAAISIFSGTA